jgi:tyrosine-protein kinase Etk/Wzc
MNQTPVPFPAAHHSQPEEVHLREYLNVIRRRRKVFLSAFVAVFCGIALYTFTMNPVYEASATLHVKDEKSKTGMLGELALSNVSPVDSEIEIIKARTNAEQVVKSLHLDWHLLDRAPGLSFRLLEFASSAEHPEYKLELIGGDGYKVWDDDGHLVGVGKSGVPLRAKGFSLLIDNLTGKAGDTCGLVLHPFNATVAELRKRVMAVELGKKTNIICISYTNTDPELARGVVNTLVQAYLDKTVAIKAEEAGKTVDFVEGQLTGVRQALDTAEKDLQGYKSASGVMKLDTEAEELIKKFSDVEKERAAVALQKKQLEFALTSLKESMARGKTYAPAVMRDDQLVSGMATKLAELEVQKRALLEEYTREHPSVKNVQGQIEELQRKIQATYDTAFKSAVRQEAGISRRLADYEEQLRKLPAAERDLARYMRLTKVNADIYTFLLQKHEEARIAKASTISNIDIVDPAFVPDKPVKPKKAKNLILGLLVGCMFGVGLAFFREYLDDTLKSVDEVKRALGLPILGIIPFIPHKGEGDAALAETLITHHDPQSLPAEAFRSLRTALHFAGTGNGGKCVLLTSAYPDEGKTTISTNLAITLAQTGARVVLVGCDLRRPSLHEMFKSARSPGLADVLAGDCPLDSVIRSTNGVGISYISAGSLPPNPAELLGFEGMRHVVAALREGYDHIIIDAAPILAVSDAQVIAPLVDLAVVVIESGRVPRKAAQHLQGLLQATSVKVAGVVINDRSGKGSLYYGYGDHYYGHGYGYRYREKEAEAVKGSWWRKLLKR